ncbi:hypothetical protein BR93DRAFT_941147 [Coniochaeta sp. PMI_546]|nr:hypothetical protein BR93DRAFT_941147 [Coniochaeta sp. PMI_546]
MYWKSFVRAGRGRMDGLEDVHLKRSLLLSRDDVPALPDIDDSDDDVVGPDTETEDDDEPATPTTAFLTVAPSSTSNPILSSSTRSIPTLTAIAHTPTFPSSTTTTRAAKATSTSPSTPVGFTTVTSPTALQSSVAASSLTVTRVTGSAFLISASNLPVPSGAVRPQQDEKPLLNSPSSSKLSPGAKAGIAIGTIAAVALLAALGFLIWKRRARRSASNSPGRPIDAIPSNVTSQPENVRSQSEIMDELMASAYATQNGGDMSRAYLDEKRNGDGSAPAVTEQPQIRRSIASWLRRHHPLDLNPLGGRSSTASAPRTTISQESDLSPPQPAQRKQDQTKFVSVWSDSTPDSSSSGGTSIISFYGKGSRYFSDSIRGTWILPPRAKSLASQGGESNNGSAYV